MRRGYFLSKEEVEKACNEDDKCLGYNFMEGLAYGFVKYQLLGSKIVRVCERSIEGGVMITNPKESCENLTLCLKKSK